MLFSLVALSLALPAIANPVPSTQAIEHRTPLGLVLAPLYTPPSNSDAEADNDSHIIADGYLVVLKDGLSEFQVTAHNAHVRALHREHTRKSTLAKVYNQVNGVEHLVQDFAGTVHQFAIGTAKGKGLRGYTGQFSDAVLQQIRSLADVKYVERDSIVTISEVEKGAPWGLARISHRQTLSFGTYNRYDYDSNGGSGVDAYVIDTGVNIDHDELEGRATWGKTIPQDADKDLNGHGSHVAGTMASRKYGVAKKANIIAVKVLGAGGSGSMSDVVSGVAWAADAASKAMKAKREGKNPKHKGSVANMSLGGGASRALDEAVNAAVEDGLHFAVAAGNDNKDACNYSPAAAKEAISVGASTIGDERAYFSNHGKCVDIMAPGLNILSIWNSGPTSTNTISGTSMASPHVAGAAAYYLSLYPESYNLDTLELKPEPTFIQNSAQIVFGKVQEWSGMAPIPPKYPELTGPQLKAILLKYATKGALTDVLPAGTPNLLLFNNYTTSA